MIEVLEPRAVPSLLVQFSLGQLTISGTEIFDCKINSVNNGEIEVRDGSMLVFPAVRGVRDIDVLLATFSPNVILDLKDYTGRTDIAFGHGNNSVNIKTGSRGDIRIVSGDGNDTVSVDDTDLFGNFEWDAFGGTNFLNLLGNVEGSVQMNGGSGSDTVMVGGTIGGRLKLQLDDGTNDTTIGGEIQGAANIAGLAGMDTLLVETPSQVNGPLSFRPGEGVNEMQLRGRADKGLFYRGGAGSDSVEFGLNSYAGSVLATLGDGTNDFSLDGHIEKNLLIRGGSGSDTFTVGLTSSSWTVGGNATFLGGSGSNVWSVADDAETMIGGRLTITGGDGADTIGLSEVYVEKKVILNLGNGANIVNIPPFNQAGAGFSAKKFLYVGGRGVDRIEIGSSLSVLGPGDFRLGGGDDIFTYAGSTPVFESLIIRGGPGGGDSFDGTTETISIVVDLRGVENVS